MRDAGTVPPPQFSFSLPTLTLPRRLLSQSGFLIANINESRATDINTYKGEQPTHEALVKVRCCALLPPRRAQPF